MSGWQVNSVIPLTRAVLSALVVNRTQHIALYKCRVYLLTSSGSWEY